MNNDLRKDVKLLKAFQGITYKEIAELLEIRVDSFYNWLSGYYDFSESTSKRLLDIVVNLREFHA